MRDVSKLASEACKNLSRNERASRNRLKTKKLSSNGAWQTVVFIQCLKTANSGVSVLPHERRAGTRENYPRATNSQISEHVRKTYRDESARNVVQS